MYSNEQMVIYHYTSFTYFNCPIWIDIIMNLHSCIKHTNKKTSLIYRLFHHIERARTFLHLTPYEEAIIFKLQIFGVKITTSSFPHIGKSNLRIKE